MPYAPDTRHWFFYREAAQLAGQLPEAGLQIMALTEEPASRRWLKILACPI